MGIEKEDGMYCFGCGRIICDLCEKERAIYVMVNKFNGNKLNVCESCYQEMFAKNEED